MRDYEELVKALRYCSDISDFHGCLECIYERKCRAHSRDRACINQPLVMVDAADAIEELLAAVPHWISVEERLPEIGVPVLVCVDNIIRHPAEKMCGVDVFDGNVWEQASKHWHFVPTHWMPLPEPPKEVE